MFISGLSSFFARFFVIRHNVAPTGPRPSYFISSHRDESSWPLVDCTNIFTNNLFIARVEENHVCQFYKICSGDHEPGQHPYHLQAYLHLAQPKRGLLART